MTKRNISIVGGVAALAFFGGVALTGFVLNWLDQLEDDMQEWRR